MISTHQTANHRHRKTNKCFHVLLFTCAKFRIHAKQNWFEFILYEIKITLQIKYSRQHLNYNNAECRKKTRREWVSEKKRSYCVICCLNTPYLCWAILWVFRYIQHTRMTDAPITTETRKPIVYCECMCVRACTYNGRIVNSHSTIDRNTNTDGNGILLCSFIVFAISFMILNASLNFAKAPIWRSAFCTFEASTKMTLFPVQPE